MAISIVEGHDKTGENEVIKTQTAEVLIDIRLKVLGLIGKIKASIRLIINLLSSLLLS